MSITITPEAGTYSHTIRVKISSDIAGTLIQAGANKEYMSLDFKGTDEVIVPIITTSTLYVLVNGQLQELNYQINSTNPYGYKSNVSGIQFKNENVNVLPPIRLKATKIDGNKFVRIRL